MCISTTHGTVNFILSLSLNTGNGNLEIARGDRSRPLMNLSLLISGYAYCNKLKGCWEDVNHLTGDIVMIS